MSCQVRQSGIDRDFFYTLYSTFRQSCVYVIVVFTDKRCSTDVYIRTLLDRIKIGSVLLIKCFKVAKQGSIV